MRAELVLVQRRAGLRAQRSQRQERRAFFIPEGEGDRGDAPMYDPPEDAGQGENRWRNGDALFAPMRCTKGSVLGVSVDMPVNGDRPTLRWPDELRDALGGEKLSRD